MEKLAMPLGNLWVFMLMAKSGFGVAVMLP